MPLVGLKPAAPASGWQRTLALDRSANGIGLDPRTVQPVVSRYTDYAIPSYILNIDHFYLILTPVHNNLCCPVMNTGCKLQMSATLNFFDAGKLPLKNTSSFYTD